METTTTEQSRTRVALIFGGQSPEHGVSCLTAASVLGAIDRDRFDVVAVGITRQGRWTQVPLETVANYRVVGARVPEVDDGDYDAVWMVGPSGCEVASRDGGQLVDIRGVDVAFALLHGPFVSPADEVTPLPVYGAGAGLYPEALRAVPGWETATPSAVGVGQVAELALRRGRGLVPAEPLYLRESDAKVPGPRKRAGA